MEWAVATKKSNGGLERKECYRRVPWNLSLGSSEIKKGGI